MWFWLFFLSIIWLYFVVNLFSVSVGDLKRRDMSTSRTSLKHGEGLRSWLSMAHLTVAARMLASYSREFCMAVGVPRDLSYPGSLKYGSLTKIRLWMDTSTCVWGGITKLHNISFIFPYNLHTHTYAHYWDYQALQYFFYLFNSAHTSYISVLEGITCLVYFFQLYHKCK